MAFYRVVFLVCIFLSVLIHVNIASNTTVIPCKSTTNNGTAASVKVGEISSHENITNSETPRKCRNTTWYMNCIISADCDDPRMKCQNKSCTCSRFHFLDPCSKECTANITRILLWLKKSARTESDAESQASAFTVKQEEPYTILTPVWAEYRGAREIGLGYIPKPVWPVIICIFSLLLIYTLILYDHL